MVTTNYHKVKDHAKEKLNIFECDSNNDIREASLLSVDSSFNDSVYEKNYIEFTVDIPAEIFNNIIEIKCYPRTRDGENKKRQYQRFIPGKYQSLFNEILWKNKKIKCGFNYKNNSLDIKGHSGKFSGKLLIKTI